jgi:hypothetical protein
MWFAVALTGGGACRPNAYTLRHYSSWDVEALRSWRLEGSSDGGLTWTPIRVHVDDASLAVRFLVGNVMENGNR